MSKLENDLKEWVNLGFIHQDQAIKIRDYDASKPESSWALSGLLALGAIIVGIGIVSLIAANWQQIPDSLKLTCDFLLLIALAYWTLKTWESKKPIQFEVLLISYLILCLASIGLISQIFHTGGRLYQALLLWSAIAFAPNLASHKVLVPFLWTAGFLSGVAFSAYESTSLQPIFHKNHQIIFMTLPVLCAAFMMVAKSLFGEVGTTRAFRYWTVIGGLVGLAAAEMGRLTRPDSNSLLIAIMPAYVLAAFAGFGILLSIEYRKVQKVLLVLILGLFLVAFHLPHGNLWYSLIHATLTITVLGLFSMLLAGLQERKLFQWILSFLGLRFLFLYFQALGGLAVTGVGLIISGGIVIGMAILWNKYRTALADWAESWAN